MLRTNACGDITRYLTWYRAGYSHSYRRGRKMKDVENNVENQPDKKKRQTAKLLVGGGIVGAAAVSHKKWVKPVIDVAVLPTHAETSKKNDLP